MKKEIIVMISKNLFFSALLCGLPLVSGGAMASNEDDLLGLLAVAKMTGICGNFQQMIQFQNSTKMEGGDAFIARFYATEAARLGWTQDEYAKLCLESIEKYNMLTRVLEEDSQKGE